MLLEIPCVLRHTNKYNTLESRYPCPILDAVDVELHGDVKAVEEVTPKHQSVLRGVYGMDPPCNVQNTKAAEAHPGGNGMLYMHISRINTPEGIMKVLPCLSSILWQS